jgi:hypothetical protein
MHRGGKSESSMSRLAGVARWAVALILIANASAQIVPPTRGADIAEGALTSPSFPAWDSFTDELHHLGDRMIAQLPKRLRNDPQVQQEVGRLLLEVLAGRSINAISADGDHPVFLPVLNVTLNVYAPNADTTYRSAKITPGGAYRLRGERGSLRLLMLGQFGASSASSGVVAPTYDDLKSLHLDASGRFDVILSPTRPAGYSGDWWQLKPTTSSLMLRQVADDWATERDPRISIERVDKPVERPRSDEADLERRLRGLALSVSNTAFPLLNHVESMRQDGYINRLREFDASRLGALDGQFYYEGAYELSSDEALIVEVNVPDKCQYRSILLTNDIYETIDWYDNQSSLNDSQTVVDRDGVLRIVVAGKDPGVPNWLDTAGYPTGSIQGRWMECSSNPIPTVRKVPLVDIRKYLPTDTPTVTPSQREQALRDRRAQAQQRPLW